MKEHSIMAVIGGMSLYHAVITYQERQTFDLMASVFILLSVLYFASLAFKKEDSNV